MASGKRIGKKSQAANDFLAPLAPTNVTATDVGTSRPYGSGGVTVTFTPTGPNAATSYTASGYCSTHNTTHTATGSSSPLTITGFGSGVVTTITVTASNAAGTSPASAPSNSVTITTVPQPMSAPSVSSPTPSSAVNVAGSTTDDVSWSAPENGGKAITGYTWTSSDGKSGTTTGTSVSVNQEGGSAQTYQVRAENANGAGNYSSSSGQVTTFSFTPFSFTPFGFTPFGFTPFGVFGFSPFGVFGFSPFGVFGFSPFGVFAFNPSGFSFAPAPSGFFFHWSLNVNTEVMLSNVAGQPNTTKPAGELEVGDKLLALDLGSGVSDWTTWESSTIDISQAPVVETTITSIDIVPENQFVYVDGDLFSKSHYILTRKNGIVKFIKSADIDTTYERYSHAESSFVSINLVEVVDLVMNKVSINCEPYDNFFTKQMLVFDRPDAN